MCTSVNKRLTRTVIEMRCVFIFACVVLFCIGCAEGKDFTVGTRVNNLLISTGKVKYGSILLYRRDKDYVYVDPKERIIKGIMARDLSRTDGEVSVTSGGVGATNVTLHFTSGRGEELNYLVLIFSDNK